MQKFILKRLYVQYNYQIEKQRFKNKKPVRPSLRHSLLSRLATKPRSVARYVLVKISAIPTLSFREWQVPTGIIQTKGESAGGPQTIISDTLLICRPNNR